MISPSFIEELSQNLKKFKDYLNVQVMQDKDKDVINLNQQIGDTSNLLERTKHKFTEHFNIKLPDYPDENLKELLVYKQEIKKIQKLLDDLNVTDESLKTLVSDLDQKIEYRIKAHVGKGQPKTTDRPLNRQNK